jgi:type IV pilus assembly protein PilV
MVRGVWVARAPVSALAAAPRAAVAVHDTGGERLMPEAGGEQRIDPGEDAPGPWRPPRVARRFTMIEVLVSILLIGVGLLGIAQLQALALASVAASRLRSLAAIEAASLAASMHADRAYWASGAAAPTPVVVLGRSISDATLAASVACTTASGPPARCSPPQLAAWDVQRWAAAVGALFPNPVSTIRCTTTVAAPVGCTIEIAWNDGEPAPERALPPAPGGPAYTLYVEP